MILFPAHPFPNFANSPFETPVTEKKDDFFDKNKKKVIFVFNTCILQCTYIS